MLTCNRIKYLIDLKLENVSRNGYWPQVVQIVNKHKIKQRHWSFGFRIMLLDLYIMAQIFLGQYFKVIFLVIFFFSYSAVVGFN